MISEVFALIPVALLIEWERPVTHARSYPAKEKINLGCRLVTGKYIIEFDAQQAGNDKITHYKYSSNEYLPLDHKVPNVFYAATDFKAQ